MADILNQIIESKQREINALKKIIDIGRLRDQAISISRPCRSLSKSIIDGSGIIAEFKRRSPSKGEIAPFASVSDIVTDYTTAGASGCSILTDTPYFGGSLTDLAVARNCTSLPLLRKDFIIDEIQIYNARIMSADAILLIAAVLDKQRISQLASLAHDHGLEVLLELHSPEEIEKWTPLADLTGINSRNLRTFGTSLDTAVQMAEALPDQSVKIAESGIHSAKDIIMLRSVGYSGFLIGEAFMSTPQPGETLKNFIDGI